MNNNILVIGGAGYIGSHCCKLLAKAGYTPITYDNLSKGHLHAVQWGPFINGNTSDTQQIEKIIEEYNILGVIMLAAFIEVSESFASPLNFYQNNVANFISVLSALNKCKAIVFSSTAAVYGNQADVPIKEDCLIQPINPYGRTKMMCEQILNDQFNSGSGISYCILRYFNASGADPSGIIGEQHNPETHLIPRACLSALGVIDDFAILGDDWPTPDGTAIRDYIHVNDLAEAHVAALEYLLRGGKPEIFNVGTGVGYSVKEIITAVEICSGLKMLPQIKPRRLGDPAMLIADNSKIKAVLNWQPQYIDIQDIVSTAYNFHFKQVNIRETVRND